MNGTITCPHCGAANQDVGSFCTACGKALPSATPSGPRVISAKDVAATSAGKNLQTDLLKKEAKKEAKKAAKKAASALLAVAILQAIFGTFLIVMAMGEGGLELGPAVLITVYGIAILFFCLYLWARKNPLPAAIVGLVLFVTVHLLDAVADPTAIVRGIVLKIIVVVVLIKAIQAGAKHRQIMKGAA